MAAVIAVLILRSVAISPLERSSAAASTALLINENGLRSIAWAGMTNITANAANKLIETVLNIAFLLEMG